MLLVCNYHTQIFKNYIGLNHCMGADQNFDLPFGKSLQSFSFFCGFHRTAQKTDRNSVRCVILCQRFKMLLRKQLRRRHHHALKSALCSSKHRRFRYSGFSASHITLNQPVHRLFRSQITLHILPDGFLSLCQFKRKSVYKGLRASAVNNRSRAAFSAFIFNIQKPCFQCQKLFENQSEFTLQHFCAVFGKMHIFYCKIGACQTVLRYNVSRYPF